MGALDKVGKTKGEKHKRVGSGIRNGAWGHSSKLERISHGTIEPNKRE